MPARSRGTLTEPPGLEIGQTDQKFPSIEIPEGKALVGTSAAQIPDDGESPMRKVSVKTFRMAATTVTNAEFRVFVEETGYLTDAKAYAEWAGGRLPTEAEWEHATRAGQGYC